MDTISRQPPEALLIIAGWGDFPRFVAEGARAAGVPRVALVGIRGSTVRASRRAADWVRMVPFGRLDALRDAVRASGCRQAVLAGQIHPACLFRSRMDDEMRRELLAIDIRNAHTLFNRLVEVIEALGVTVLPSSAFMAAHIPEAGVPTRRAPDRREAADIAYGNTVATAVCDLDIGQTVVVRDGVVLAVEGFDGTNATITRGGRLARRGGVVVKVAKAGHDMRFDIPVIGLKTIRVMRRAGLSAISVQAGRTLVLDLPGVVAAADRANIAIEAIASGLPPAPVF